MLAQQIDLLGPAQGSPIQGLMPAAVTPPPRANEQWIPTHKNYRPATDALVGRVGKVLVDLNISQLGKGERGRKRVITRYYSVKTRDSGRWTLFGHTPRLVMENVTLSVSERQRLQVIERGSKTPHAYMTGEVTRVVDGADHETHCALLQRFREHGAYYLGYNPYILEQFVICDTERLPPRKQCESLPRVTHIEALYAYETGILAQPRIPL